MPMFLNKFSQVAHELLICPIPYKVYKKKRKKERKKKEATDEIGPVNANLTSGPSISTNEKKKLAKCVIAV